MHGYVPVQEILRGACICQEAASPTTYTEVIFYFTLVTGLEPETWIIHKSFRQILLCTSPTRFHRALDHG